MCLNAAVSDVIFEVCPLITSTSAIFQVEDFVEMHPELRIRWHKVSENSTELN